MVLLHHEHASGTSLDLPPWLRQELPDSERIQTMKNLLTRTSTTTVCQAARCPNTGMCWGRGVATFMILGEICTRACRFCAVTTGAPKPVDRDESRRIAAAVRELDLRYVVITSVTRDDLADGGAQQFVETVGAIRLTMPQIQIELLIPDFNLKLIQLHAIAAAGAQVIGHNLETVARLFSVIRPQADYHRSLDVLRMIKEFSPALITKSGFMVGLGETEDEIKALLHDIKSAGCDIVTIGQYLRPSQTARHAAVERFVSPEEFEKYQHWAQALGFRYVKSAPLVRSSFLAEEGYQDCLR